VLSGGGLCDELITRPEESYRLCGVVVCDLECSVLSGGGLCDELITRSGESYRLCCLAVCDLDTS